MKESFDEHGERVVQSDDYIEAVLRDATREMQKGTTLTKDDVQYDGKQSKQEMRAHNVGHVLVERKLKELTATSEFTPEEQARMRAEVFNTRSTFFYENNRIKSVDVLCRQLREVLTAAGMNETDIHALFRGELANITKQLATYEEVKTPRAEQAQEEMALRARLLSTATARFFEATKKTRAEVVAPPPAEPRAVLLPAEQAPASQVTTKLHASMEDQANLAVSNHEEQASFSMANQVLKAENKQRRRDGGMREQHETSEGSGDNGSDSTTTERTMEGVSMSAESPKIVQPTPEALEQQRAALDVHIAENDARRREAAAAVAAVVSERPQAKVTEKKTGWWDKDFRDAKLNPRTREEQLVSNAETAAERDVDSLMAQADRLIALTRNRREQADVSHKEAKSVSADYAAARSEITKIKNRLRAILDERDVAHKRAEIGELRKSLAEHLWNLRKDFPVQKETAGVVPADTTEPVPTDPLAERKAAAVDRLQVKFAEAKQAKAEALRAGKPVLINLPDGRRVQGETELIHDNGTTLLVSWLEEGVRQQQIVDRSAVIELSEVQALPEDGTPLDRFSGDTTLREADEASFAAEQNSNRGVTALVLGDSVSIPRSDGTRSDARIVELHADVGTAKVIWQEGDGILSKVVAIADVQPVNMQKENATPPEPYQDDVLDHGDVVLPQPDYAIAAREAGADAAPLLSIEAAVHAAREKLENKIAETKSYHNSILAGAESDSLMVLKRELAVLAARLRAAKASPAIMRPEEVQAMRSQLATIEYQLVQMEATAPKKLLGLMVPRATDGPFAVRAFRDALNIEWQPFKRASEGSTDAAVMEKRQAFERMFKVLAYVPETGITEAEAAELRAAAEKIALPQRISGTFTFTPSVSGEAAPAEKQPPLVLTDAMRVREELPEHVARILRIREAGSQDKLKEALPAIANRELDPKKETKARRWFERGGILTVGLLLGLLAGSDQEQKDATTRAGGDPYTATAPASSDQGALEPAVSAVFEVTPNEGGWPTAEADASGNEVTETNEPAVEADGDIEPRITDITDRIAAESEAAMPDYVFKASGNLWDFAEGDVEDREPLTPLNGLSELQKNLVLNDMVTALKYNKDLMRKLGLRSGNPNKIFPGEVIKTQVLVDLLEEIKRDRGLS